MGNLDHNGREAKRIAKQNFIMEIKLNKQSIARLKSDTSIDNEDRIKRLERENESMEAYVKELKINKR